MAPHLHLDVRRLDPKRIPVVLMGGITLVRTLGMAGIQAIVASPNPTDPVFASRHAIGHCVLPPFDHAEAAVDAIVALGDRLAPSTAAACR
jgi:hypothetical protein